MTVLAARPAPNDTRHTCRSPTKRAFTYALVLAVAIAAATFRATTTEALVSFLVISVSLVWLHARVADVGYISLGGITLWLILLLFAGKWILLGEDLLPTVAGPQATREETLAVIAAGTVAFAAGYRLRRRRRGAPQRLPVSRPSSAANHLPLVVLGLGVGLFRLYAATRWNIGVPSRVPSQIPFRGVLFFVTTVVPSLVAATLKLLGDERRSPSLARAGIAVLLLHTIVGVGIGWRGEPLRNLLIWLAAARYSDTGARPRVRLLQLVAVGVGIFVTVGVALSFRGVADGAAVAPVGVAEFLFERAGGIDYLSPVVGQVQIYGSDARLLDETNWNHFLKRRVYGIPEDAQVAFAATAFGWWYAALGSWGVVVGFFLAGVLCTRLDARSTARARSTFRSRLLFVALVSVWTNFLLEGTALVSLKSLLAALAIWQALAVYEQAGTRSRRRQTPSIS